MAPAWACTWSTSPRAALILIWGSNSIASNLHFWTFAQAAKAGRRQLIAIDPRRTETADKCHQHIALLPGTDAALALGLMHELIRHDWLDHDHRPAHPRAGRPCAKALQWPPRAWPRSAASPREEVVQLARDYAQTAPAAIRLNYGMQRVRGGGNRGAHDHILPALIGAWRHRAGLACCCPARAPSASRQALPAAPGAKAARPAPST